MNSSASSRRFRVFSWVFLAICFIFALYFWNGHYTHLLDSDFSSEMVLAAQLARENRLLSTNWFYSTEIRLLDTQLISAPLFHIFSSWHLVRLAGTAIWLVLYMAVYYYLCTQLGLTRWFALTGGLLLLPISSAYFDFVLFGGYYVAHVITTFLYFTLLLHWNRSAGKRLRIPLFAALLLLAFVSGISGLRYLLILHLPLLVCTGLLYLSGVFSAPSPRAALGCTQNRRLFAGGLAGFAAAGVGVIINSKVLPLYYHYASFDEIEFQSFSFSSLEETIKSVFKNLGYQNKGAIFSAAAPVNLASLILVFSLCICLWALVRSLQKQVTDGGFAGLFFLIALLVYTALYLFTDMYPNPRYLIPILVYAMPVILLGLQALPLQGWVRSLAGAVLALCVVCCGVFIYAAKAPIDTNAERRVIAATVLEQGYTEGYATFWNANLLTELSGGQIYMRSWGDHDRLGKDAKITDTGDWLMPVSDATTPPTGKVFAWLSRAEAERIGFGAHLSEEYLIYSSENQLVYGYPSYQAMLADAAD